MTDDNRCVQLAARKTASTKHAQITRQAGFPALRLVIDELYGADEAHSIGTFPFKMGKVPFKVPGSKFNVCRLNAQTVLSNFEP